MLRTSAQRVLVGALLVGMGIGTGAVLAPPPAAWGEVRRSAPPEAFKSGDQISVPILQDIAGTLRQIDGRLARLEAVFKELSTPRPRAATN